MNPRAQAYSYSGVGGAVALAVAALLHPRLGQLADVAGFIAGGAAVALVDTLGNLWGWFDTEIALRRARAKAELDALATKEPRT